MICKIYKDLPPASSTCYRKLYRSITLAKKKYRYFYISTQLSQPLTITTPVGDYMFKVNNRTTRTRREICSKLTIKTPERRH